MTLDDLPDSVCPVCAKGFEATRPFQIYCGVSCCNAYFNGLRSTAMAEERAKLRCQDCGAPIPEAKRTDKKLCPICKHKRRLANCKANRERTKAGTNGQRGRNQFTK